MSKQITVFEITRHVPGEDSGYIYTSNKIAADKFIFDSLFMPEVNFSYRKTLINEIDYEKNLELTKSEGYL